MSHTCAICERPIVDSALVCTVCTNVAIAQLAEIVRLLPDARHVAAGQVRRGTSGGVGKPGSRSPGDDGALDALHAVQNALTTICRDICETRGLTFDDEGRSRPLRATLTAQTGELVAQSTPSPSREEIRQP